MLGGTQLAQRLGLDLPDPLTCDREPFADLFERAGIPVGPALTSQLFVMAATGRRNDQALSARIPFMAAGPSKGSHFTGRIYDCNVSFRQTCVNQKRYPCATQ
jgi:hypothetical protein